MKLNNVIALIGVIIAAISLFYVITGDEKKLKVPPNNIQSTTGNNSPVISDVEGNVTIKN